MVAVLNTVNFESFMLIVAWSNLYVFSQREKYIPYF